MHRQGQRLHESPWVSGEVIVADNGSTDGSQEVARQLAADALALAQAQPLAVPNVIADARQFLVDGDVLRASWAFKDAVNRYKDALAKAEAALSALL